MPTETRPTASNARFTARTPAPTYARVDGRRDETGRSGATDRSAGACLAVEWAARFAHSAEAELLAIQVVAPGTEPGDGAPDRRRLEADLERSLPSDGIAARAVVETDEDIARAILNAARRAEADMIVIGSSGMRGRTEFLLGNTANRVTHLARCTVVVVNTTMRPPPEELEETVEPRDRARGDRANARAAGAAARGREGPRQGRRQRRPATSCGRASSASARSSASSARSSRPGPTSSARSTSRSSPRCRPTSRPCEEGEVVAAMQRELGVPWEDVFASIEPEPLAAGTIGQVHRAQLVDGTRVVVKVQRPNAEALVDADLSLLESAVRPAGRSNRVKRVIDLPALVEELSGSLRRELDFTEEAQNLERMAGILASYPHVDVPSCHTDLSTPRLLVMDEVVGGVPLNEAPAGEERTEATRELMQAFYRQVLEEGFFHADPHPGNLLWADGTIWLIDFGMVGRLDASTRRQLLLVMLAFVEGDTELLVDVALDMSGIKDSGDLDRSGIPRRPRLGPRDASAAGRSRRSSWSSCSTS